jgi:hypothetical protein
MLKWCFDEHRTSRSGPEPTILPGPDRLDTVRLSAFEAYGIFPAALNADISTSTTMPNNGRPSYARRRETRIIGRFSHGVLQPYGMPKRMNPRTWRFSIDWRLSDLLDRAMSLITALDVMEVDCD